MAVAPKRPQPAKIRREIEWTTIPVWYLYGGGIVVLVILSLGGFIAYQAFFGAAHGAGREIAKAAALLEEATKVASAGEHDDKLIAGAGKKLEEANAAAGEKQWDLAKVAARESQRQSQEVLDNARQKGLSRNVATFKRMSGTIEVKKSNSTEWIPASMDTQLGANDLVRSDSNARAKIVYQNGTEVVVEPNSLIQILPPESSKDSKTEVPLGQVTVTTLLRPGGKNLVSTPDGSQIEVGPDTMVGVKRDEASHKVDVQVGSGEVTVKQGNEAAKIGASEVVTMDPRLGTIGEIQKLPEMPRNLVVAEQKTDAGTIVTLHWEPVADAQSYIVEVGQNQLLIGTTVQRPTTTKNSLRLDGYPDGEYYWRVTAINATNVKSLPSPIQVFRIGKGQVSEAPPIPVLTIESINVFGANVSLKGRAEPNVTLTVDGESQEVKADGSFQSITGLREDGRNEVIVVVKNALGGVRRTRILVSAQFD